MNRNHFWIYSRHKLRARDSTFPFQWVDCCAQAPLMRRRILFTAFVWIVRHQNNYFTENIVRQTTIRKTTPIMAKWVKYHISHRSRASKFFSFHNFPIHFSLSRSRWHFVYLSLLHIIEKQKEGNFIANLMWCDYIPNGFISVEMRFTERKEPDERETSCDDIDDNSKIMRTKFVSLRYVCATVARKKCTVISSKIHAE